MILPKEAGVLDPSQNELHLLDEQQTLEEIIARFTQHHLVRPVPRLIHKSSQISNSPIDWSMNSLSIAF